MYVSVSKVLLEHIRAHHLHMVYGYFPTPGQRGDVTEITWFTKPKIFIA